MYIYITEKLNFLSLKIILYKIKNKINIYTYNNLYKLSYA